MKKLLSIVLFIVPAICACTFSHLDEGAATKLSVEFSELSFPVESTIHSLQVRSGKKWTVTTPDWLFVQSIENQGAYSYEWSVTFLTDNNKDYDRDGVIVFNAGSESVSVNVDQKGKKGKYVAVESVSLDETSISLEEGDLRTLYATIYPDNASDKSITWSSSNPSVASVSSGGYVSAKAIGTAIITAKTIDGGKTASCSVTVNKKFIHVTSISLDNTSLTMTVDDTQQLTATVLPADATDKSVSWYSSNSAVASVSNSGLVTAISSGTARITAQSVDGEKTAYCTVSVNNKIIHVTSISLDNTSLTMTEGDTQQLIATVLPADATDKSIVWSSGNTSVASVSSSGVVTAKSPGTAKITAKTNDGNKTASCSVTVKAKTIPVTGVSLDVTSLTLTEGETQSLVATVTPSNATDKSVSWTSSNTSVASVSSSGVVTANAAGSATITVMTTDGGKTASCEVTVKQKPLISSLTLSESSFNGYINKYYPISVTFTPTNAQYNLVWSSSNTRVAILQGNGLSREIYTKDFGKSEITVKDNISGRYTSIEVSTIVTDFEWTESTSSTYSGYPLITINEGQEYQLHFSHTPSSATHLFEDLSNYVFYEPTTVVSSPSVISIDTEGKITGLKAGTIGIKPTGLILKKSSGVDRVYITVKAVVPVTGVSLNKNTLSLEVGSSESLVATVSPSNATNQAVTWTTSNSSVATVSSSGLVTAKSTGSATITVTTADGAKTASCSVTVLPIAVSSVSLNKSTLTLYQNDSESLIATVYPSNAYNKTVSWSSSNTNVVTVSSYGQVTAKEAGSATVTVTTNDGGKTASCSVTVLADPYGAVDLGLSVKWASFNYGSSSITGRGGYYMYGDPTGTAQATTYTAPSVNNVSGTQYDIVRQHWGGNWRIPTRSEINELYSNCTWSSTTLNGTTVLKVTGPNGASIYLPPTGYAMPSDGSVGSTQTIDTQNAYLMSSESYSSSYGRFVYIFYFTPSGGKNSASYNTDYVKFPIRPVR